MLADVLHSEPMTEATDDPRFEAAKALRKVNDALVAHDAEDDLLRRIASIAHDATDLLRNGNRRDRAALLADDLQFELGRDRVGRSSHGSIGHRVGWSREDLGPVDPGDHLVEMGGEEAVVRTTLGTASEGAPGRAHGGMVAALFDDFSAFLLPLAETAAYTGEITVRYHRPVPIEAPLEFRSRIVSHESRKLRVTGECMAEGQVVASTEVLFITIDFQTFGQTLIRSEN
jgi:acyl-coenzyme A thioesterase PaaI-like protein